VLWPGTVEGGVRVKKVLFVCVENSNRSQMAEGLNALFAATPGR
jgi:protein-tyrosine-phosphatase